MLGGVVLNFERLELFKKLEPNFKIDRILSLTEAIEYEGLTINEGIYIVSEPFRGFIGGKVVTIIDLENTMRGHSFDISGKTYEKGFSCWRISLGYFEDWGINLGYFEEMKEFKHLTASSNFLWEGEDNGN